MSGREVEFTDEQTALTGEAWAELLRAHDVDPEQPYDTVPLAGGVRIVQPSRRAGQLVLDIDDTWPYTSVFPKDEGWRFEDFTEDECKCLAFVFDAAMSEAGYPTDPEPDDFHKGNFRLNCKGYPRALIERARAIALASIGREMPDA